VCVPVRWSIFRTRSFFPLMLAKVFRVYSIVNLWTGRTYIGVTGSKDPMLRLDSHVEASCNAELQADMRAASRPRDEFSFHIVDEYESEAAAFERERELVELLSKALGVYRLYNRQPGGMIRRFDGEKSVPKFIRDSLLCELTHQGKHALSDAGAAAMVMRGYGRAVRRKKAERNEHARARAERQLRREQERARRRLEHEANRKRKQAGRERQNVLTPKAPRPAWMSDASLLPKRPPPAPIVEDEERPKLLKK
jgi:hypothetical protein